MAKPIENKSMLGEMAALLPRASFNCQMGNVICSVTAVFDELEISFTAWKPARWCFVLKTALSVCRMYTHKKTDEALTKALRPHSFQFFSLPANCSQFLRLQASVQYGKCLSLFHCDPYEKPVVRAGFICRELVLNCSQWYHSAV